MGKSLIIKNADFSENGIPTKSRVLTWTMEYSSEQLIGNSIFGSATYYMLLSEINNFGLTGKYVGAVRLYALKSGIIKISKVLVSNAVTIVREFSFTVSEGENTLNLPSLIELTDNVSVGVYGPGILKYNRQGVDIGWKFAAAPSLSPSSGSSIPIDLGIITFED